MKITTMVAVLVLAGTLTAPALEAQRGPPDGRRGPGMMEGRGMMEPGRTPGPTVGIRIALEHREALELTEHQVGELEALLAEVRSSREAMIQRMRALRAEAGSDRVALRERMGELQREMRDAHEPYRDRLTDALTEGQLQQLAELRPGPRGGMEGPPHRPRGRRPGGGGTG